MIVIVDTNILFSACITAEKQSKISEILFRKQQTFKRISCQFAVEELFLHRNKLIKASKLPPDKLDVLLHETLKQIVFYSEDTIASQHWNEADRLTKDVDHKDIAFVALTLQTDGILWTGDKKLSEHLKVLGFDRVVNTVELSVLLNIKL